jgi:osmoprotectant transport system permease protein
LRRLALSGLALSGLALVAAVAGSRAAGRASVRIGSKVFTESHVLGEAAAQLARSSGADVEHRVGLGGTRVLWEALVRGDLDLYPEYTGTLVKEILAGEAIADEPALRAALARHGVAMTGSLGFEDTYAIGMRRDVAARLGVERLSDLARRPELRLGFSHEFLDREDGWPAVRARYGLSHADPVGLDHDVAYRALAEGRIDATDLYSTDANIQRFDLAVLEDDRHAFPEYRAVFVYRSALAAQAAAALAAVRRLEGRISEEEMIAMNARAELDRIPAARVAAEFLERSLDVNAPVVEEAFSTRLLRTTGEHLAMVLVAVAAAVAVGVPLGVLSTRSVAAGHLLLGATGVVQTIPALALLVFMIPLLGIGARPAIAALFLYGLLPIVRNTHAGLTGLSPELRESADSLGLPLAARLWRIDLPLATPSILAGIRTSAVITVGTATLGALIGAGGFGQPILAGIRLASVPLTMEGAVPAALLALAIDGSFGLAERVVLPRGLRTRRGAQRA